MQTATTLKGSIQCVDAKELAEALGVSERQVRRWGADGTIPSRKISHKVRRYRLDEVVEWLESTRQGPGRDA